MAGRVAHRSGADQLVEEGAVGEGNAEFLVAHDLATCRPLQRQLLRRQLAAVLQEAEVPRSLLVRCGQRLVIARAQSQHVRRAAVAGDPLRLGIVHQPDGHRNRRQDGVELGRAALGLLLEAGPRCSRSATSRAFSRCSSTERRSERWIW